MSLITRKISKSIINVAYKVKINTLTTSTNITSNSKNLIIEEEVEKGIVHIQLNRPEKMNSLNMNMFHEISNIAKKYENQSNIRCIILSGAGKSFCTGLDVNSMIKSPKIASTLLDKPAGTEITNLAQDVGYLWRNVKCPVIAVLHGMCLGGGLQIALGADFRISTPTCKISILEAKWGLIPDMSATISLRELIPIDIAKELTMTGRIITGNQAKEYGLVTKVDENPYEKALELAREIKERSPNSVNTTKILYQSTYRNGCTEKEALQLETKYQTELIGSWNQIVAAAKNFGIKLPYKND